MKICLLLSLLCTFYCANVSTEAINSFGENELISFIIQRYDFSNFSLDNGHVAKELFRREVLNDFGYTAYEQSEVDGDLDLKIDTQTKATTTSKVQSPKGEKSFEKETNADGGIALNWRRVPDDGEVGGLNVNMTINQKLNGNRTMNVKQAIWGGAGFELKKVSRMTTEGPVDFDAHFMDEQGVVEVFKASAGSEFSRHIETGDGEYVRRIKKSGWAKATIVRFEEGARNDGTVARLYVNHAKEMTTTGTYRKVTKSLTVDCYGSSVVVIKR